MRSVSGVGSAGSGNGLAEAPTASPVRAAPLFRNCLRSVCLGFINAPKEFPMELSKGKIGCQLLCSILSKLYGTPYSIGMAGSCSAFPDLPNRDLTQSQTKFLRLNQTNKLRGQ